VVLIGDPMLYYMLQRFDDDFQELFKVKADFAMQTDWNDDTPGEYARFIGSLCRDQGLRHFDPSGVAAVVELASRIVSDQRKLATRFGEIVDLVHESSFWAGENGHELVSGEDVRRAVDEKTYRANRIEERIHEMIFDGTITIDTDGVVIGQVNGISVLTLGDYAFGKPSRITARTHVGRAGVVNIDRESKLSGRIHTKGTMILSGYLGGRYGSDIPLALSGSITFEQLYEEVDGDSASSSELYALLSSLSGLPLRQDIAVTGSVDQHGRIQAIGGVNEKIEGFFDVCRVKGLTGRQGVMIPRTNAHHLMLRQDVVEAVREGRFHIYQAGTVDEGIQLLTGTPAGAADEHGAYPEGSVNRAVQDRLRELAERVRSFSKEGTGKEARGGGNGD
jgi:predicted ATP-dependent protease